MGYMYVPEIDNHRVRKISPSAEVTTFISGRGFADGPSSVARLHFPAGIDIDKNGNLYLAENGNNAIRKISPDGYVTTLAGSGSYGYAEGVGSAALF